MAKYKKEIIMVVEWEEGSSHGSSNGEAKCCPPGDNWGEYEKCGEYEFCVDCWRAYMKGAEKVLK